MMSMEKGQTEADLDFVRHSVLNSLRMYRENYHDEYGELVLCCDDRHSWRRDYFPQYKAGRRTTREESPLNWTQIFGCFETLKTELREIFPYKFIQVENAEADDIIYALTREFEHDIGKTLILSGDKDFIQLQKYPGVRQYNPITKRPVTNEDPHKYIKEHVMRGDKSDGIPNFLSSDDTFVTGVRQKPISQKKMIKWVEQTPEQFCLDTEQMRNYHRNQRLIDFDFVPEEIEQKILDEYNSLNISGKKVPLEYFKEHQLNELMQDFFFRSSSPFKSK